ncbi:MAG: hypothetical protein M1834_002957 [Cirrosporium novae-zelandiae]|nr:MAG: hypothetical protein M1834_002957 [Cirrosporium novae-zelandiae]
MVRCRNCTGGQTVELQCKYCNLWKDLELFGKAQRRNPEDAICKLCNDKNKIQDTEPVKEDEDDFGNLSDTETLPSNIYESSELDALSDDGLNSVAGNLNIHDHARPSSPASSSGGGVALDKGKQRARNTTVWVVQNRPAHQAPTTNRGQAFANDYNSSRDTSRINTVKASSATNSWTKFSSANSAASGTTNVPRPKVTAAEKHGFAKVGAYRDREAEATLLEDSCSDNDDTDDDGDSDGSVDENNPARYY